MSAPTGNLETNLAKAQGYLERFRGAPLGHFIAGKAERGVAKVLDLLEKEVLEAMCFMGARNLAELTKKSIRTATPVVQPGLFSAFPGLKLG